MPLEQKIKTCVILTHCALFNLSISSCQIPQKDIGLTQSVIIDTVPASKNVNELKYYYSQAHSTDSLKYKKLFLSSFPNNFSLFNSLYGFSDEKGAMPLNDVYEQHINFLCTLSSIGNEEFLHKLVKLGIGGSWDADAVNLLQDCIIKHSKGNIPLTVKLLQKFNEKDIKSFWFFLFDGPHPEKVIPIDLVSLRQLDPKIATLSEESFKEVHLRSELHGN